MFNLPPPKSPAFHILAFYSTKVEPDHVAFAHNAIGFYKALAMKDGFEFSATTDWSRLNDENLKTVEVIVWLNDFPQSAPQKAAFERFEERGADGLGTMWRVTTTSAPSGTGS